MIRLLIAFLFIFSIQSKGAYERSKFGYRSYSINYKIGFYTGKICKTNIDHVVSLKDAYQSGANKWNSDLKKKFSNDKSNHVPACYKINSSKGSATPKNFLRRSNDGKGLDYKIIKFCDYLEIYYQTKIKYNLSFKNNDPILFLKCDLIILNTIKK